MKSFGLIVVAAALVAPPGVGHANPIAGSCLVGLDDGVATKAPGWEPHSVSMMVPDAVAQSEGGAPNTVVDLSFVIDANGRVSGARVMCASSPDPRFTEALLHAAPTWRFMPIRQDGAAIGSRVAYRFIVQGNPRTVGRVFLGFQSAT